VNAPQTEAFNALLDEFAHRVAALVAERLTSGAPGMVDQASSPLGRRRHCAAVKRRVGSGKPGAALVGRRHLLSVEALAEELARVSGQRELVMPSPASGSVRAELERELRIVKGGGRRG
jgi:hypothetical protein